MNSIEQISFKKKAETISILVLWPNLQGYELLYSLKEMDFTEVYAVDASASKTIHNLITIKDISLELQLKLLTFIKTNYDL